MAWSSPFENWTFQDWTDWRMGGVWTRGARCRILNTRAIGVQGGMSIAGVGSEIRNSRVEGFSDDGMRINASDCGIYDSWISDRVKINEGVTALRIRSAPVESPSTDTGARAKYPQEYDVFEERDGYGRIGAGRWIALEYTQKLGEPSDAEKLAILWDWYKEQI